jgi:hypothetical protein
VKTKIRALEVTDAERYCLFLGALQDAPAVGGVRATPFTRQAAERRSLYRAAGFAPYAWEPDAVQADGACTTASKASE